MTSLSVLYVLPLLSLLLDDNILTIMSYLLVAMI